MAVTINHIMHIEQQQEETDNTTKNLVHEIVRECNAHQLEISETFCTYYVKLLTLDPYWKISPEKKINRIYIQYLVSFIIKQLQLKESATLATLRMQQVFRTQCADKTVIVKNFREIMRGVMEPLIENVLTYIPDENNKQRLFKRITLLLSFRAFIGHHKNMQAISKDTAVALRSVMDDNDFAEFIEMKPEARLCQVEFLHYVVMGIRLFHHDGGRQLSDFHDIPKILARDLEQVQIQLYFQRKVAVERVNMATTAIECVFQNKYIKDKNNHDNIVFHKKMKLPEGVTPEDVQYTFEFLTLAKQYEIYVGKIIEEVNDIEESTKTLSKRHREILTLLNDTIKFNIGIAATTVFPMFKKLADTWTNIQDQFLVLAVHLQLFEQLSKIFASQFCNLDLWKTMIGGSPIMNNKMRRERNKNQHIQEPLRNCDLLKKKKYTTLNQDTFAFAGFCVWAFVETKGALIPGDPNLGVLRWNQNLYIFSDVEAAVIFDQNPDKILRTSIDIIRKKPELINLLKVYSMIHQVRNCDVLIQKIAPVRKKKIVETQTEVHPLPARIDKNHIWNEWDMEREAIKLADISRCATHSTQTIKSHFKCPMAIQTTDPRDKGCQTKTDNYTNVAKDSNYIFGLRGRKDDVQHVIELTRPIFEQAYYTCAAENKPIQAKSYKACRKTKLIKKMKMSKQDIQSPVSSEITLNKITEELSSCLCINELIN